MPDVFTDEAGTYDLTITTSADWTISSGGMPNGDNYATGDGSIAPTYNTSGADFEIADGTAWTIEYWMYYTTATAGDQMICCVGNVGGTTNYWTLLFTSAEASVLTILNTANGAYLQGTIPGVVTANTWHHMVHIKATGNTITSYQDNVLVSTNSTVTGTARHASGTDRLFVGVNSNGSNDINTPGSGLRIAKLAIYNAALTTDQINDHYLAMTAS